MTKGAVYNEFDKNAAAWLRELIKAGLIAPGDVDERSIKDVCGDDYRGYTQVHCFAGIGIWSAALRKSGWSDERPIGTASCPCQGFSVAGKGLGFADPRHLWPDYLRLVDEAREQGQPWADTIVGEQSANAGEWLDLVFSDLESRSYACAAADIPAAGFGMGAHIRQRFYWVADRHHPERWADMAGRDFSDWPQAGRVQGYGESGAGFALGRLADGNGGDASPERQQRGGEHRQQPEDGGAVLGVVHRHHQRRDGSATLEQDRGTEPSPTGTTERLGHGHGHGQGLEGRIVSGERRDQRTPRTSSLAGADWLWCRDEKFRPVESGTFPLVATYPARVALLRGIGNALDLETATQFIAAYMDAVETRDVMAEMT